MSTALLRRGRQLEAATLGWNVVGVGVLAVAVARSRSTALAGFGLDSLIEIAASTVVLWELADIGAARQRRALRLIRGAFLALATYLAAQSVVALTTDFHPRHSPLGIAWTAATAGVMLTLASAKQRTGVALDNPVLITESRVTVVDAILAAAVLVGITLDALVGAWWADPTAGLVIVGYALREARAIAHDLRRS